MTEKTQVRFIESEETGELIGFVSRPGKKRELKGVYENSRFRKKICVLADNLKGIIQTEILYDVELKAMRNKNGYIVIAAKPAQFEAQMESVIVPKAIYRIEIIFGHKHVHFDPKDGRKDSYRTIDGVVELLSKRVDLLDKEKVIADFKSRARLVLEQMRADGYF